MERLNSEEWAKHYNVSQVNNLLDALSRDEVSYQSKEMLKLTRAGEKVLEIGSGSGATSLYLSKNGRETTALDFSQECLNLTSEVSKRMNCKVDILLADAEKDLPFSDNHFDVSFQAGLLEHFHEEERVKLLKTWGRISKRMVSIIPNASSLAYRTGKAVMEKKGKWTYGLELPQYSLVSEFHRAGFKVTDEYTIGAEHALEFLPKWHYLRIAMTLWLKSNPTEDDCHQGYLLVTIGEKI